MAISDAFRFGDHRDVSLGGLLRVARNAKHDTVPELWFAAERIGNVVVVVEASVEQGAVAAGAVGLEAFAVTIRSGVRLATDFL
jgi:hypothetical protein